MINLTCTFWTKLNICRGWVYSSSNDKCKQHLDLALKRWLSKCGFKATKFLFFVSPYIYKYCTWSGIYMPTLVRLGSILTNEKFGNGATIVSIGHSTVFLSLGFSYVFFIWARGFVFFILWLPFHSVGLDWQFGYWTERKMHRAGCSRVNLICTHFGINSFVASNFGLLFVYLLLTCLINTVWRSFVTP